MEKPPKIPVPLPEEPILRWADDTELTMEDTISISSEEETGSEYDSEQRARTKSAQEIWNLNTVWKELMVILFHLYFFKTSQIINKLLLLFLFQALPDAEEINDLILKEDLKMILRCSKSTALLLTSWLGKSHMLSVILQQGTLVNSTDNFGR